LSGIIVSSYIKKLANKIHDRELPIKSTEDFEIYEVNERPLKGWALLIFKEGKNFLPDELPEGTIILPVGIGNRSGYLIGNKQIALAFKLNSGKKT
jgi:hypothetical protein